VSSCDNKLAQPQFFGGISRAESRQEIRRHTLDVPYVPVPKDHYIRLLMMTQQIETSMKVEQPNLGFDSVQIPRTIRTSGERANVRGPP
jgi:hypothetical protein